MDTEKAGGATTRGFSTRNLTDRILPKATVHWMKSIGLGFGLSELRMSHIGPKVKILVASFQVRGWKMDDVAFTTRRTHYCILPTFITYTTPLPLILSLIPFIATVSSLSQIYCQLPDTLQLKFPGSTTKVFSALSFVNLSSISAGSPQCYTSFDYVDKLLMTTLTPICIEIVVCICFLAHVAYKSRAGWHPGDFGAIVSTYVSFFIVVRSVNQSVSPIR